jgi:predicted HicB family RNase H-like nuclease
MMKQLSFPVEEALHQRIKIRAIVKKMDLKDWIIQVLTKELDKDEKKERKHAETI